MVKVLLERPAARALQVIHAEDIERATGTTLTFAERGVLRPELQELTIHAPVGSDFREACRRMLDEVERTMRGAGLRVNVLLPRWLASALIGFRGANVKEICRSTGTLIHVDKDVPEGNAGDQIANVQGPPASVLKVFARMLQYQQDRQEARGDGNDGEPSEDGEGAQPEGAPSEPPGRPPSPPPPWRLEEHPQAPGEWYYLNTDTGETTWDPPGEEPPPESEPEAGAEAEAEAEAEERGRPPTPPPPWRTLEHPEAPGEWYYLNEDTGETCWELPEELLAAAQEPPEAEGLPEEGAEEDAEPEPPAKRPRSRAEASSPGPRGGWRRPAAGGWRTM